MSFYLFIFKSWVLYNIDHFYRLELMVNVKRLNVYDMHMQSQYDVIMSTFIIIIVAAIVFIK